MSLERNKELARAAIAIWSTGDFSRVLEIFAPDYVMHQHHHGAASVVFVAKHPQLEPRVTASRSSSWSC